ncbi:MAG: sodium:glutamate symporter, partial [Eggerthellaceae bacterium]|nr:sodium:glutamate symporter [Eggerthellaceae bacterium]
MDSVGILKVSLDIYQTLGVAIVAMVFSGFLKKKIHFLNRICIPSPVVGGLIFSLVATVLIFAGIVQITYDTNLKEFAMVMFFTSIVFQADFKVLKRGGKSFIVLLALVVLLIFAENFIAVGVSTLIRIDPLLGLGTGSISMVGGPGTAAAFGPLIEASGVAGATTVSIAAAAFGLAVSSLIGGPLAKTLIKRNNLTELKIQDEVSDKEREDSYDKLTNEEIQNRSNVKYRNVKHYITAFYELGIAMAAGTFVSMLLNLTGLTFPIYIGSLIAAFIMRNVVDIAGFHKTSNQEIEEIGDLMLSIFVSITMISLDLTVLASLALPIVVLLLAQTSLIVLFCLFVVYPA